MGWGGAAEDHAALDDVLEFAHVPRPIVGREHFDCFLGDRADSLAKLASEAKDRVARQQRNVVAPFPQRRNVNGKHVHPIVQVGAEFLIGDQLSQIAIGGGDHTHIDMKRFRAADALERSILQNAQELGLELQRQVADLVEK